MQKKTIRNTDNIQDMEYEEDKWTKYDMLYPIQDEGEEAEPIDEYEEWEEIEELKRKAEEEIPLIVEDVSEETLITPEEEIETLVEVSTESSIHPCLREIEISDSQLKLVNPYTVYPIPDDPGLMPAFWVLHERPPEYPLDGVQTFHDAVKRWHLRSIGTFKNMLLTDEVNLRYYGIESRTMRAICEALANNAFVQRVDLKDNKLSTDACIFLNDLLLKNNQIFNLSLSGCRIGVVGAEKLRNALLENTTLQILDFSKCELGNEGFEHIATALIDNEVIEELNFSKNQLDKQCVENLRDLLLYSGNLKHLDLSWNSLTNTKTWKILGPAFLKNDSLVSLNLSWNSLGSECLMPLCRVIARSQNLKKLDLSSNKFNEKDATSIAKVLSKNKVLQEFYMGNNPIKEQGALALVRAITPEVGPNSVLQILDLENVWADKNILQELNILAMHKPWVSIRLGGILSNYQLVGPNVQRLLFERARFEGMKPKKKKRQRNFGEFVMSLKDKAIKREKFMELVKKFKIKLSASLVNEIMNMFEGPGETVDQKSLKLSYLTEYPTTMEEINLPKKEKK